MGGLELGQFKKLDENRIKFLRNELVHGLTAHKRGQKGLAYVNAKILFLLHRSVIEWEGLGEYGRIVL